MATIWRRLSGIAKEDQETNSDATFEDTNCDKLNTELTLQTHCAQFL